MADVEQWAERLAAHPAGPLVTAGAALVVVLSPGLWRWARTVITIVHEGGHALAAVLVGRRLHGIRLHTDTSGLTVSRGKRTGPGMVFTAFAGYPAPAVLGLGFAVLVRFGLPDVVLLVAAIMLLGVLIVVRNAFGFVAVIATAAGLAVVVYLGGPRIEAAFVAAIAWFLMLGSLRATLDLRSLRRAGGAGDSDVDQLGRLTGIPGGLWWFVMVLGALVCLVVGGLPLLEPVVSALTAAAADR